MAESEIDPISLLSSLPLAASPAVEAFGERRRRARCSAHWQVRFLHGRPEAGESTTLNLSSSGFYCRSRTPFAPGETVWCMLFVPAHHQMPDLERPVALECKARVLRVETSGSEGVTGVAFRILEYRVA